MAWRVDKEAGLILDDENHVVGSVAKPGGGLGLDNRIVEILWSGPGGDIVYRSEDYAGALAFIAGVGMAMSRMDQILRRE